MKLGRVPSAGTSAVDFVCKECVSGLACAIWNLRAESPVRLFRQRATRASTDKPMIPVVPRSESTSTPWALKHRVSACRRNSRPAKLPTEIIPRRFASGRCGLPTPAVLQEQTPMVDHVPDHGSITTLPCRRLVSSSDSYGVLRLIAILVCSILVGRVCWTNVSDRYPAENSTYSSPATHEFCWKSDKSEVRHGCAKPPGQDPQIPMKPPTPYWEICMSYRLARPFSIRCRFRCSDSY